MSLDKTGLFILQNRAKYVKPFFLYLAYKTTFSWHTSKWGPHTTLDIFWVTLLHLTRQAVIPYCVTGQTYFKT